MKCGGYGRGWGCSRCALGMKCGKEQRVVKYRISKGWGEVTVVSVEQDRV